MGLLIFTVFESAIASSTVAQLSSMRRIRTGWNTVFFPGSFWHVLKYLYAVHAFLSAVLMQYVPCLTRRSDISGRAPGTVSIFACSLALPSNVSGSIYSASSQRSAHGRNMIETVRPTSFIPSMHKNGSRASMEISDLPSSKAFSQKLPCFESIQ